VQAHRFIGWSVGAYIHCARVSTSVRMAPAGIVMVSMLARLFVWLLLGSSLRSLVRAPVRMAPAGIVVAPVLARLFVLLPADPHQSTACRAGLLRNCEMKIRPPCIKKSLRSRRAIYCVKAYGPDLSRPLPGVRSVRPRLISRISSLAPGSSRPPVPSLPQRTPRSSSMTSMRSSRR